MISLPIPDNSSGKTYSTVHIDKQKTYYDIMKLISPTYKQYKKQYKLDSKTCCHLDPDISTGAIPRLPGWRGIFGQIDKAAIHLQSEKVKSGDIFLFFGWFHHYDIVSNSIKKLPGDGMHVLFGYFEIDMILRNSQVKNFPLWATGHPHLHPNRLSNPTNTIFIATDHFTHEPSLPGYGLFNYHPELILTKPGCSRSVWQLPECFTNIRISWNPNGWKQGYFQSVPQGQEFVVNATNDVQQWTINLIKKYATRACED